MGLLNSNYLSVSQLLTKSAKAVANGRWGKESQKIETDQREISRPSQDKLEVKDERRHGVCGTVRLFVLL